MPAKRCYYEVLNVAKSADDSSIKASYRKLALEFHPDRNPGDFEQVMDIVDVWFESGSTHAFVLEGRNLPWPADLYLEGSDQHRGWFHSSLIESSGTRGRAPFDVVLTHGFCLDEKGEKMSKSVGNVVDPFALVSHYGRDQTRYFFLREVAFGQDGSYSPEAIATAREDFMKTQSVGQRRQFDLHGGDVSKLEIHPNVWAGIGLVRGGVGTALVGSYEEVADRIEEYHDLGFDHFIMSGHPHVEEAYWFGEGVLPELRRRGLVSARHQQPGEADSVLGRHAVTNAR